MPDRLQVSINMIRLLNTDAGSRLSSGNGPLTCGLSHTPARQSSMPAAARSSACCKCGQAAQPVQQPARRQQRQTASRRQLLRLRLSRRRPAQHRRGLPRRRRLVRTAATPQTRLASLQSGRQHVTCRARPANQTQRQTRAQRQRASSRGRATRKRRQAASGSHARRWACLRRLRLPMAHGPASMSGAWQRSSRQPNSQQTLRRQRRLLGGRL